MSAHSAGPESEGTPEGRHAGPVTQAERTRRIVLGASAVAVCFGALFLALHWMAALLWVCIVFPASLALGLVALVIFDVQNRPAGAPPLATAARSAAPWAFSKRGWLVFALMGAAFALIDHVAR